MSILGVDYGRAKIGLAIGIGSLAEPLGVVKVGFWEEGIRQVEDVVKGQSSFAKASEDTIEKVVVGVSEREMRKEQEKFSHELKKRLSVPVITWDETLSTQDAQSKAIEAGISRQKRKKMEDAFAACVVLQSYLDCNP